MALGAVEQMPIVGAPPLDGVNECRGGSGAVFDQRVIKIEED